MIQVSRLQKSFGARRVLHELDLVVDAAAVTLLVGANGAGKSTLLRVLAGLSRPDAGGVVIDGCDLQTAPAQARVRTAFLPQAPRFHPRLTSRQVVAFYGRLHGRSPDETAQALAAWGLEDHARTATMRLSGGLRQRLALAVMSLARASVLLLDEPGLSLDPEWRRTLQEYLFGEARRGRTVVVATHLLGEWEGQAHRCLMLESGRIRGELAPERLREEFPLPPVAPAEPTTLSAARD